MALAEHKKDFAEQRKYIRLKSVFPVEFTIVRLQGEILGVDWQQGYTCNVSKGGLCLETVHINEPTIKFLNKENIQLDLRIRIPLTSPPIKAVAEVAWFKKIEDQDPAQYIVGLKFRSITDEAVNRILSQARWLQYSTQIAVFSSIVLLFALVVSGFYNYKLRLDNETLINNFIDIQVEENKASLSLTEISREKEKLNQEIQKFSQEVDARHKELELIKVKSASDQTNLNEQIQARDEQIAVLKKQINEFLSQKAPLESQLGQLVNQENKISDQVNSLAKKKVSLQPSVVNKMHSWLKYHQNPLTGLVLSFEGDQGVIKDWAFIYDQALAVNVFLLFDNVDGARKVLGFFNKKAQKDFKGFPNGYYYDSGDISEFTVHCGPNIWLGIAVMQYVQKTKDQSFVPLAKRIADWLITIQDKDPAGGLKGGPEFSWFATEHNLDAYAFFNMLYQQTQDERYRIARDKVLSWLQTYSLIPHGNDYKSPPIKRGRGDSTIATDTFAWALAALGPEKLVELNMDPEQVMNFAEQHCAVTVNYKRPSGAAVSVSGFDFSKTANVPRGGMISPEWTSQMIVSYQMLSRYFGKKNEPVKSAYYREKAQYYLSELNKLIIASPSPKGQGEGCLPYATLENADTGHGWSTPFGDRTCSIAGTAYMVMAIKEFNPMTLGQMHE